MSNKAERRAAKRRLTEANTLEAGMRLLSPLLTNVGFTYRSGDSASSSGGSFANCSFIRGVTEIGLIVRRQTQMGNPNYFRGYGYAAHDRVLAALGLEDRSHLFQTDFQTFAAKDGGDPFEALRLDFKDLLIPVLVSSEEKFHEAIDYAVREYQDQLRGKRMPNEGAEPTRKRWWLPF